MDILLDTHMAIWVFADSPRLPERAREYVERQRNRIFCSSVSAWEVQLKHAAHPENLPMDARDFVTYRELSGFEELSVCERHVLTLDTLRRREEAPVHNDPFDRLLISQAKEDGLLLLTHDQKMFGYDEPCIVIV